MIAWLSGIHLNQTDGPLSCEVLMTYKEYCYKQLLECFERALPVGSSKPMPEGAKLIGVIDHWPDWYPFGRPVEIWQDKTGVYLAREQET